MYIVAVIAASVAGVGGIAGRLPCVGIASHGLRQESSEVVCR